MVWFVVVCDLSRSGVWWCVTQMWLWLWVPVALGGFMSGHVCAAHKEGNATLIRVGLLRLKYFFTCVCVCGVCACVCLCVWYVSPSVLLIISHVCVLRLLKLTFYYFTYVCVTSPQVCFLYHVCVCYVSSSLLLN